MSSEDKEAQEDELLALASIYDEDEFKRAESAQGGETRICLELPQNFKVFVSGELRQLLLSCISFSWCALRCAGNLQEYLSVTDPVLCF